MVEWVKEHPILAGTGVVFIVILIVVMRRSSGSGVIMTGPSDAALNATLAATVQLATLSANSASHASDLNAALAAKRLDAGTLLAVTGAQRDVALTGIMSDANTQQHLSDNALYATQYQTQAVVQAQTINANRDITVTGIQAGVAKDTTTKQLAAQRVISQASVDVATIAAQADQARTSAALTGLLDTNRTNLEGSTISSDTAKTLAQINANSVDLQTKTQGNIYTDYIDSQAKNVEDYLANIFNLQSSRDKTVTDLVKSGQINKGGEGGANQVAILDNLFGNFGGSAVASQGASNQGIAGAGMLSSVVGTIGSVFTSLFGGPAKVGKPVTG